MYNNSIETKEINSIYFNLQTYKASPFHGGVFFNMEEGEQVVKCTDLIYAKRVEVILY